MIQIYCDGLGFEGGASTLVILYKGNHTVKLLHYHLGPLTTHTVYEFKLIRLLLTLHLLLGLTCQLLHTVIIGLDNQAMICSLSNQTPKPAHYILNAIHTTAEKLHQRQDQLQNKDIFCQARQQRQQLSAKSKGVINLQIHWHYAEQSQITLTGNPVCLMTEPQPFPDQQISPLTIHPHELLVAVLVSNCHHTLYIVQLHPLIGTVFGKALLVKQWSFWKKLTATILHSIVSM